ncbi:hypothetical protein CWB81_06425 [Pseudoalteromonas sp. S1688]|uniref:Uncharacterized protein n=1 Tax=Pseudoalteromonas tetraodonis TaxID=43659 RepID=A0ABD4EPZ5_9GAMM|nr:hypothetical protein A2I96_10245 [Pseudoalteromonas spiralis]TMP51299.1 hypothetical protein CWB81_06425 [Pseudoalteromonas sp. S1688]
MIKPHNFYIQPFIIYTSSLCINEFIAANHQYSLILYISQLTKLIKSVNNKIQKPHFFKRKETKNTYK